MVTAFLVGASAPADARGFQRHHRGGGHASGAAIGAAAGIVGGFLVAALLGKFSEEKTAREEIRVNAGLAHRAIGPGSVAVVTDDGFARAAVSEDAHDVLLPAEPGGW